jgi:hypothetical protein
MHKEENWLQKDRDLEDAKIIRNALETLIN